MKKSIFMIAVLGLMTFAACGNKSGNNAESAEVATETSETEAAPGIDISALEKENGHEYVDLGLPSGLKWAATNVGASQPTEYGDYFAWGETQKKESYSEEAYAFGSDLKKPSKYNAQDKKAVLDSSDDAAQVNWGGKWRMPTRDECLELYSKTKHEVAEINGVKGVKFIAENGNFIFIPAGGSFWETSNSSKGDDVKLWTKTFQLGEDTSFAAVDYAFGFKVDSNGSSNNYTADRCTGMPIRAVFE